MMEFYLTDASAFVEDIIFNVSAKCHGGELEISPDQRKVLDSISTGEKKISIRSGRSCGKSVLMTWIVLWFLCTRPRPKVVATAPTFKQVNDVLWTNMARWLRESLVTECFTFTKRRVYLTEDPEEWYATAVTATKPEAFQGYHDPHFLLVCDEASGIKDEIWDTVQGSLSEDDNLSVLTGNPTQTSGFFFDSHNKNRGTWKTFHFSSLNSPFTTAEFIEDYRVRYGERHALYKIHILGEFPSGSPDSFIPIEHVLGATQREVRAVGDIQIGVDVAHYGDDFTAIVYRHGKKVYPVATYAQTSIPDTVGLVKKLVKDIRREKKYDDIIRVCVDAGGVGAGVADELSLDRENNIECIPVNFGASGNDTKEYYCTVLYGNVRDAIHDIQLPDDEQLVAELSNRRYKVTPKGKERLEPKSEYKKEFGASPDKADAVVLAFADTVNRSKIVKSFDHLDSQVVFDIYGKGYIANGDRFCSIFQSKDRVFHILYCKWTGSKLVVMDEMESEETVITVSRDILKHGPHNKISGNDRMFGEHREDVSSQFRKYNISIYENYRYDEVGAIETLNMIVKAHKLVINSKCAKMIQQLRQWSYDKNRANLEIEFGLCYSLLNIISELKDKIVPMQKLDHFNSYSKDRENAIKIIGKRYKYNKNSWEGW